MRPAWVKSCMNEKNEAIIIAENFLDNGKYEASEHIISKLLAVDKDDVNALMIRAKISYKLQRWGDTLNDLNQILALDPQHQQAASYKQMVMNILTFWNKDNYNP